MPTNFTSKPSVRTASCRISLASPASIRDRKSTRLNSSHGYISYAVFCLKKKKTDNICSPSILLTCCLLLHLMTLFWLHLLSQPSPLVYVEINLLGYIITYLHATSYLFNS